jgi:hypothetical protein
MSATSDKEHLDILTVSVSAETKPQSKSESESQDKALSPHHQTQLWSLMFETLKDILYKESNEIPQSQLSSSSSNAVSSPTTPQTDITPAMRIVSRADLIESLLLYKDSQEINNFIKTTPILEHKWPPYPVEKSDPLSSAVLNNFVPPPQGLEIPKFPNDVFSKDPTLFDSPL